MTSTLPPRSSLPRPGPRGLLRSGSEIAADLRHRRPLVAVTVLGGAAAAAAMLVVCMAVGVVGWFLSDAGSHGSPSGGLRAGAIGWLLGHGSGVAVGGTVVTAIPLGVTALCAWSAWRFGLRVGDSVSGHGPDAERLADGERDMTVPASVLLFVLGYIVVALGVRHLVHVAGTSGAGVVFWSVLIAGGCGGTAIAIGSGRAATWVALLPASLRATVSAAMRVLVVWAGVCLAVALIALLVHGTTALNLLSELHVDAGSGVLYVLLSLLAVPNAVLFSGAYLLGPGFSLGVGTTVTTSTVHLGALPVFPLLAAVPHGAPGWARALVALAPLTAFVAVAWAQYRHPTVVWRAGLLRGAAAGVVAAIVVGLVSGASGGAVGPGRMSQVAPHAGAAFVHAVFWFTVAGFLAGAVMTFWQRRKVAEQGS